jgi:hypothetical protein
VHAPFPVIFAVFVGQVQDIYQVFFWRQLWHIDIADNCSNLYQYFFVFFGTGEVGSFFSADKSAGPEGPISEQPEQRILIFSASAP